MSLNADTKGANNTCKLMVNRLQLNVPKNEKTAIVRINRLPLNHDTVMTHFLKHAYTTHQFQVHVVFRLQPNTKRINSICKFEAVTIPKHHLPPHYGAVTSRLKRSVNISRRFQMHATLSLKADTKGVGIACRLVVDRLQLLLLLLPKNDETAIVRVSHLLLNHDTIKRIDSMYKVEAATIHKHHLLPHRGAVTSRLLVSVGIKHELQLYATSSLKGDTREVSYMYKIKPELLLMRAMSNNTWKVVADALQQVISTVLIHFLNHAKIIRQLQVYAVLRLKANSKRIKSMHKVVGRCRPLRNPQAVKMYNY